MAEEGGEAARVARNGRKSRRKNEETTRREEKKLECMRGLTIHLGGKKKILRLRQKLV